MSHDTCPTIEVSRRIEASAARIFEVIADPRMHPAFDGSDMLRGAASSQLVTGVGDVFVMDMHFPALGDYQMDNHVVEFELNRRISWEPVAGVGHPEIGGRVGHRWGFQLTPEGPDATIVTETYDCSRAPQEFREQMNNGRDWVDSMEDTLGRLEEIVSRL